MVLVFFSISIFNLISLSEVILYSVFCLLLKLIFYELCTLIFCAVGLVTCRASKKSIPVNAKSSCS